MSELTPVKPAYAIAADWISIEGEYRGTQCPLRDIAARYGLTEGAIRKRAKKHGWSRDPAGSKRAMVDAALAGSTRGTQEYAIELMQAEAAQDIADMRLSLRVTRAILAKAESMLLSIDEPSPLKTLTDTVVNATNNIRRIRKLDDAPVGGSVATGGNAYASIEFHVVTQ